MCLMTSKVSSKVRFYSSKCNLNTTKFSNSKKMSQPQTKPLEAIETQAKLQCYRGSEYLELGIQVKSHVFLV